MTAQPSPPVPRPTSPERTSDSAPCADDGPDRATATTAQRAPAGPAAGTRRGWLGSPPRGPLLLGLGASLLMMIGAFGAGGVLVRDPLLTNSPVGFWRYGHGRELATALIYLGVALLGWAWVRLGRDVLAGRVGGRAVLATAVVWIIPMLAGPPLFTRDVFSYLAQGALPLAGFDPYAFGPEVMPGILSDNVHYFWQDTPAPYGPLFILLAKGMAAVIGDNIILGVVGMRLLMLPGLVLLVWALPELTRRLGGRVPVALWVAVANPVMIIHMVGGGHNDLLVMGLLASGAVAALRGRHVAGVALVTAAMAVKASAGIALPFLVLVWAQDLSGSRPVRILKAGVAGVGVFAAVFGVITLAAQVGFGWLPALSAPSMIVNWLSLPTGAGELAHAMVNVIVNVPKQPFINVGRIIGAAALLYIAVRQWWAARDGGPDAIRRAGIVLFAVAVLSPATLPWYVSWGMALLAMAAWTPRALTWLVFGSLWLVIVYYPNGEAALYNWAYLAVCAVLCGLAAYSLHHPDPLRLGNRHATVTSVVSDRGAQQQPG
ncbi:polyprenol phosphomannose-dependent alpha 1,6 mannosyltransferase MptB [Pseudonocardia hispaniensis]|uniref:Polyprenol phosphomannose-dependent alpha 1,6 mannosyltransferase MptB n=1 Tax=Pseudonocardia hispaniensis TaxID=904933 RepID=A0ABW1IY97_9PSEU